MRDLPGACTVVFVGRFTKPAVGLTVLVLVCLGTPGQALAGTRGETLRAGAAATPLLSMRVDTRRIRHRRRLPRDFIGFSSEVPYASRIFGTPATGVNPVADGLFSNIRASRSGGPTLRVGGSSADQTWWNPTRAPRPPGLDFDIDATYFQYMGAFARRNASPLLLTLNLVNSDPATAVEYARGALSVLGPRAIRGFELGNEPDTYQSLTYFTDPQGRPVKERPEGYSFTDYLREYKARADILRGQLGPIPLVGPSACCRPEFISGLPQFLAQERSRLSRASLHEYVGAACPGIAPGTPGYPTRRKLLGADDMNRIMGGFRTAVRQSASVGKKVELTETNSFACGGQPGVSDTFAAALWGAEYLMRTAGTGIVGANLHTFGRAYSPFDFAFIPGRGWSARVRPLYYGVLLFSRATAGRATMLLDPVSRARVREGANAVAFPTLAGKRLRVMVLAKDARRGGIVKIAVPRGARVAELTRLTGRSLGAKGGVKLAGQAAGSRTGRLSGKRRASRVRRRDGAYSFRMAPASGALLELRVRR